MVRKIAIQVYLLGWVFCTSAVAQQFKSLVLKENKDTSLVKYVPQPTVIKQADLRYNYYQRLGVACKAEYKLEKATRIPFRFRLGSLAQTDYMERKPNASKP